MNDKEDKVESEIQPKEQKEDQDVSEEIEESESPEGKTDTSKPFYNRKWIIGIGVVVVLLVMGFGVFEGVQRFKVKAMINEGDQKYDSQKYEESYLLYQEASKINSSPELQQKEKDAKELMAWKEVLDSDDLAKWKQLEKQVKVADASIYRDKKRFEEILNKKIAGQLKSDAKSALELGDIQTVEGSLDEVTSYVSKDDSEILNIKNELVKKLEISSREAIKNGDLSKAKELVDKAERHISKEDKTLATVKEDIIKNTDNMVKEAIQIEDIEQAESLVAEAVRYSSNEHPIIKKMRSNIENKKAELERIAREQEEARKRPPLVVQQAYLDENSIGTPEAYVIVHNVSDRVIDAYKVEIRCYNSFGEPVKDFSGSNIYRGIAQDHTIYPGGTSGHNSYWLLAVQDTTRMIEAKVIQVHFTDGTTWELDE